MGQVNQNPITVALFDFDGTLSTLRHGWEQVMEPMMLEMIAGNATVTDAMRAEVRAYIDESTGIQTIHQMKWLAEAVKRYGFNGNVSEDPWELKAEYNRRLMGRVLQRRMAIAQGRQKADDYLMAGSIPFLRALQERGVQILIASGTDDADVREEALALGVLQYADALQGAKPMAEDCAKEAAIRELMETRGLRGDIVAVIGDGKVEIALGNAIGARTLGLASNESARQGIDEAKRSRLVKAGAQKITGDFLALGELLVWLGLEGSEAD